MKIKKILFVGLGGAGQRHLRIFKDLLPAGTEFSAFRAVKKTPLLNSNFTVNSSASLEEKYNLQMYNSLDEAFDDGQDLVVISNPTSLHFDVAQKAAKSDCNIFIEKPFSHNLNGFEEFRSIVLEKKLRFFISFQRRFHTYLRGIKKIIANGELGKIINANFNVASYVPEWHPYEDFKELYACRSELGGGVLLTEIHELDLCHWYFGLPASVTCIGGNYSDIQLDVEDTVHLTLDYRDFAAQINLCFMQKHNRRDFFIAGTKGYVEWNQDGNRFLHYNYEKEEKKVLADPEYTNDAMFYSQASFFLEEYSRLDPHDCLEVAWASQAIADAARESMSHDNSSSSVKSYR